MDVASIQRVSFTDRFRHPEPVVLDGGMARELVRRGLGAPEQERSNYGLTNRPDLVLSVHRDFIAAGAEMITTNTFGLTRRSMTASGARTGQLRAVIEVAVSLARLAASEAPRRVAVAGSMSPLGPVYRPDLLREPSEMSEMYAELAGFLAEAGVDLVLAETLSSFSEAVAALLGGRQAGIETWVSFAVDDDGKLRSGMSFREAVERLARWGATAVLANCATPQAITRALTPEVAHLGVVVGGYANALEPVPSDYSFAEHGQIRLSGRLETAAYAETCARWVEAGARVVGGCCGVGPAHIAAICEAVKHVAPGRLSATRIPVA